MALVPGTQLGPYEIIALLGAGGMGEVYRARDTRLDRIVAVKILPEPLAADPDFRERFDREARAISSLSHPHICPLFDVGEAPGSGPSAPGPVRFLVMEYLEGESLADRIGQGPVPVDQSLTIAIEIGSALDAAHRFGIIHRDLKPGNVMLTKTGAKLLDFGLAKTGAGQAAWVGKPGSSRVAHGLSPANLTAPPTMTTPLSMTAQGTILGTFQYMAPEQLEGSDADPRTDIFAFGCLLYEMLAGKKAFHGKTQVSLIGSILKDTPPPVSSAQTAVPASLNWLIGKCLAKDPDRRWQTAADLVSQLEFIADGDADAPSHAEVKPVAPASSPRVRVLLAAAAVALAASTGAAAWWLKPSPAKPGPVRFTIAPSADLILATFSPTGRDFAISPDGAHLVYHVGTNSQNSQLLVRGIDQLDAVPLRGLPVPGTPFISPDGRWIGFGAPAELRKVSMTGGPSISLCKFSGALAGASWGSDDAIVFATSDRSTGLLSVPASGGEPKVLTKPDAAQGEADHLFPFVLPGRRAVLFTIVSTSSNGLDNGQVAVLDLQTGQRKTLIRGGGHAEYASSGHIVYAAAGSLRAVRFDPVRLEVLSDPVPVVEQVMTKVTGAAQFSLSTTGTLVYVTGGTNIGGGSGATRTLTWVNRQGREEPVKAPPRQYAYPRLSPDGAKMALEVRDQDDDIWIWNFAHETLTRLTFDPSSDTYPVWTPDSKQVIFSSVRAGGTNLFRQSADGTGAVEQLTKSEDPLVPNAITPDGAQLVVRALTTGASNDIVLLHLGTPPGKIDPLIKTQFNEQNGEISPDGHWLAYQSNESGNQEIYVRPFPNVNGGRWQVSSGGGSKPLWAPGGRELFFVASNGRALMSTPVQLTPSFSNGNPAKLFEGPYALSLPGVAGRSYDVSKDGQKFLVIKDSAVGDLPSAQTSATMTVVLNWFEELKARVPAK